MCWTFGKCTHGAHDGAKAMVGETAGILAWTKTVAANYTVIVFCRVDIYGHILVIEFFTTRPSQFKKKKMPPVSLKNVLHENVNINFIKFQPLSMYLF